MKKQRCKNCGDDLDVSDFIYRMHDGKCFPCWKKWRDKRRDLLLNNKCPECKETLLTMIDEAWQYPVKFCPKCKWEHNPNPKVKDKQNKGSEVHS